MPKFFILAFMIFKFPTKIDKRLMMFILIAITGFLIRLYNLSQNPLDFDESIHAFTSFLFFEDGFYRYNPTTHGPFLYYITSGIFHVLGDGIFSARLLPALFGGAMVLLLLPLRRYLGDVKFLLISGMIAYSYYFIVYSRQIRHDIFLAFFILAFIVCMNLFFENHSKSYLYLGFACLALTMAIKPTTFIFMFIFIYFLLLNKNVVYKIYDILEIGNKVYVSIIYILIIFIAINYLFYTSISDGFIRAIYNWIYAIYSHDSNINEILFRPYYYYFVNLIHFEFIIFVTGLIGCVYYLLAKDKNYFSIFCSFWAIVSLLIFSTIKYKTPELITNILLPFIFVSGLFLGDIIERFLNKNRMLFTSIIIVIILLSSNIHFPLTSQTNNNSNNANNDYEEIAHFIELNNDDSKKVYFFVNHLDRFYDIEWPLPWYLRENNLFMMDGNNILELNILFDPKYNFNYEDFVQPYETKGIIITSTYLPRLEKLGYNNSKYFERSGIYIYY